MDEGPPREAGRWDLGMTFVRLKGSRKPINSHRKELSWGRETWKKRTGKKRGEKNKEEKSHEYLEFLPSLISVELLRRYPLQGFLLTSLEIWKPPREALSCS